MGAFSPIPSYTDEGITTNEIIYLSSFVNTVKNAGDAYLTHSCGHDDASSNINPILPNDNIIPVETGASLKPTTGLSAWEYTEQELRSNLQDIREDFLDLCKDNRIIYADDVWSFLTEYFHELCRIYGQRFSYYTNINGSITEWLGIGLLKTPYKTLDEYKTICSDLQSTYKLKVKELIKANNIHTILQEMMKLNANLELWYDAGSRNKITKKSGRKWLCEKVKMDGAFDAATWWAVWTAQKNKAVKNLDEEYTKYGGYVDDVDEPAKRVAYWVYSYTILEASFPTTLTHKIHGDMILTLTCIPENAGTLVPAAGQYQYSTITDVNVSETPKTGRKFKNWSDGTTSSTATVHVDRSKTFSAIYDLKTYTVTLVSSNEKFGITIGSGIYEEGTDVVIKAIPLKDDTGSTERQGIFKKWSDNNTNATRTINNINQDITLTANFFCREWNLDTYTECDEGTAYEIYHPYDGVLWHYFHRQPNPPTNPYLYTDLQGVWHHNYSDDHGHVYITYEIT